MHPTLTIHLSSIAENYRTLRAQFAGADVAAVVKANAYGLGAAEVAKTLLNEGATWLFVATLEEAIALRENLPHAKIAVFHGAFSGQEAAFVEHGLIPIINHISQLERWMLITAHHPSADYMLHIDTGMCRLGLSDSDVAWLVTHGSNLLARKPLYLLSHLACANDAEHPKNAEQLARFTKEKQHFTGVPTSFCNSSGIYLAPEFHGNLARPGSALYGINPTPTLTNPMQHVADLSAPILMIRVLDKDESVGYGATAKAKKGSRIAIVQMGYADGLLRILSNKGRVFVGGVACNVVGRVSMDMIAVDISHLPEQALHAGMMVDIICVHQPVDALADAATTIGYEIFTRLGDRVLRLYS
jgi:alanine racemase